MILFLSGQSLAKCPSFPQIRQVPLNAAGGFGQFAFLWPVSPQLKHLKESPSPSSRPSGRWSPRTFLSSAMSSAPLFQVSFFQAEAFVSSLPVSLCSFLLVREMNWGLTGWTIPAGHLDRLSIKIRAIYQWKSPVRINEVTSYAVDDVLWVIWKWDDQLFCFRQPCNAEAEYEKVAMSSRDVDVKSLMKEGWDPQEINETYLMIFFRWIPSAVVRGDLGKLGWWTYRLCYRQRRSDDNRRRCNHHMIRLTWSSAYLRDKIPSWWWLWDA